eukprot:CAMPEP_0202688826 /NCGR_PEP_ID=MMETSP1385-20130828/4243_1 /ASSEMBLY_ACC=CAM_ASM_000861 /TAXON_ID=933848 /ORGANISM="Elphidium margaritaceum" /LENGTH=70 /DNA_ID=CAMNT_0049343873 /DNA_START=114 /DNA_END=326 /DNA_ORIENTATION=-
MTTSRSLHVINSGVCPLPSILFKSPPAYNWRAARTTSTTRYYYDHPRTPASMAVRSTSKVPASSGANASK